MKDLNIKLKYTIPFLILVLVIGLFGCIFSKPEVVRSEIKELPIPTKPAEAVD